MILFLWAKELYKLVILYIYKNDFAHVLYLNTIRLHHFLEIRKFLRIFHTASTEVNDNWPKAVIKMYGFSKELISLRVQ